MRWWACWIAVKHHQFTKENNKDNAACQQSSVYEGEQWFLFFFFNRIFIQQKRWSSNGENGAWLPGCPSFFDSTDFKRQNKIHQRCYCKYLSLPAWPQKPNQTDVITLLEQIHWRRSVAVVMPTTDCLLLDEKRRKRIYSCKQKLDWTSNEKKKNIRFKCLRLLSSFSESLLYLFIWSKALNLTACVYGNNAC